MNGSTLRIIAERALILLPVALCCLERMIDLPTILLKPQWNFPATMAIFGIFYSLFISYLTELNTVLHTSLVAVLFFVADDRMKTPSWWNAMVSDSAILFLIAFVASHLATTGYNDAHGDVAGRTGCKERLMWVAFVVMTLEIMFSLVSCSFQLTWMVLLLLSVSALQYCQKVYQLRLNFIEYFLLIVVVGMMWAAVLRADDGHDDDDTFGCKMVLDVSAVGALCTMATLMVTVAATNLLTQISYQLHHAAAFLLLFSVSVVLIFPSCISAVVGRQHRGAFDWILEFLAKDGYLRGQLCCLWLAMIVVGGSLALVAITHGRWTKVSSRKVFHVLIAIIIMPGLLWQSLLSFSVLAMCVACCGFVVIETFRTFVLSKSSGVDRGSLSTDQVYVDRLSAYYNNFVDRKDLDRHWLSAHLYLLLGCAMPILLLVLWETVICENAKVQNNLFWFLPLFLRHAPFLPHLGWIVVGVGDSAAAIIGKRYGKHTWLDSKRTVEGSLAMLLSTIVAALCTLQFMPSHFTAASLTKMDALVPVLFTLIATTLLEAVTSKNDNLILPIFASALYMAIIRIQVLIRMQI